MSFLPSGLWAQPLEADSSPSPCKVQLRVGAGRVPLGCFHPRRKGGKEGNPPSGAASVTPEQDRPSFPCPCVSSLARSLGASGLPRSCAPPSVLSVTSGTVLRSQPDRVLSPRPALREPHEWVFLHTHFPGSLGGSALSLAVPPRPGPEPPPGKVENERPLQTTSRMPRCKLLMKQFPETGLASCWLSRAKRHNQASPRTGRRRWCLGQAKDTGAISRSGVPSNSRTGKVYAKGACIFVMGLRRWDHSVPLKGQGPGPE